MSLSHWKIALTLALLAGVRQTAFAQVHAAPPPSPAPPATSVPSGGLAQTIVPGKWDISYKWEVTLPAHLHLNDGTSALLERDWSENGSDVGGYGFHERFDFNPNAVAVDSDTTGFVTVICLWVADTSSYTMPPLNPTPVPAPKTLTLLESADAWAIGYPGGSVDDGLGDPTRGVSANLSNPFMPAYAVESGGVVYPTTYYASHLTTHQVSDGQVTIIHSMRATSAAVEAQADGPIANLSYGAVVDTRTLSLRREGARGETFDVDGTGHGDTIYSYHIFDSAKLFGNDEDIINWQTFFPVFGGAWHTKLGPNQNLTWPDVSYVWNPPESQNDWATGLWSMHHGAMNKDLELPTPLKWTKDASPATVGAETYTATDNVDGASATANYILKIHEPLELQGDQVLIRQPENYRTAPGAEWGVSSADDGDVQVYKENSVSWTIGATFGGDVDVAGWARLSITGDVSRQTTVNLGVSVTVHHVPQGYGCYAIIFDVYDLHSGVVKLWDEGGFVKDSVYSFKEPSNPPGGVIPSAPLVYFGNNPPPPIK